MPKHPNETPIRARLGMFSVELTEMRDFRDETGSGSRCVKIGDRRGVVMLEIYLNSLTKYAKQALANKSGKSRALNGAVRFHAVKKTIKETPVT